MIFRDPTYRMYTLSLGGVPYLMWYCTLSDRAWFQEVSSWT